MKIFLLPSAWKPATGTDDSCNLVAAARHDQHMTFRAHRSRAAAVALAFAVLAACGEDLPAGGAPADARTTGEGAADAAGRGDGAIAGRAACDDRRDNDGDGYTDGDDPHCTTRWDDCEDSFLQCGWTDECESPYTTDCFFDNNSGTGDDHCQRHVCCGLAEPDGCPDPSFDPGDCAPAEACAGGFCPRITIPGCDCFGCCTLCDGIACAPVLVDPCIAPDCTLDALFDPAACPACTPDSTCGTPCDPDLCILCPGQDVSDLPDTCGGEHICPRDEPACADSSTCPADHWCSSGCCVEEGPR